MFRPGLLARPDLLRLKCGKNADESSKRVMSKFPLDGVTLDPGLCSELFEEVLQALSP